MANFEFSNWNNRRTHSWNADQAAVGMPRLNSRSVNVGANYGRARATGRFLNSIARTARPLSNTFNAFGRNVTYGRAGISGGLGMLAMRNGANMMDRMRYGDYGGAMMSGAMTAAAGYGAYSAWMTKGAFRSHFRNAASFLVNKARG